MMRWGGVPLPGEKDEYRAFQFGRPIRWLLCLLDDEVIPVRVRDLVAGRVTRAHPNARAAWLTVPNAAAYKVTLRKGGVEVDQGHRAQALRRQLKELGRQGGGKAVDPGEALLDQTVLSVEKPTAYLGAFDADFLALPRGVLEAAMVKAQEYFPIEDAGGKLLPHFIGVRDGGRTGLDTVRKNAEWVLRAKLIDARFFYDRDLQHDLAHFVQRTRGIVFMADRGSLFDKQERLARIIREWDWTAREEAQRRVAELAAPICKFDRATQLVAEYPGLQGVLGAEYLRRWPDYDPAVATAVAEHYDPPLADDGRLSAAALLALADKLDTLVNAFAAGHEPTGSADPYGLRREATTVMRLLAQSPAAPALPTNQGLGVVLAANGLDTNDALRVKIRDLVAERLRFVLRADASDGLGLPHDLAEAVLRAEGETPAHAASLPGADRPWRAFARGRVLPELRKQKDFKAVAFAASRCANILPKDIKPSGLLEPSSGEAHRALHAALNDLLHAARLDLIVERGQFEDLYHALRVELVPAVNAFFEAVLVNDPDPAVRAANHTLVLHAYRCFTRLCDFTALEV